jgi:hypothetical protein
VLVIITTSITFWGVGVWFVYVKFCHRHILCSNSNAIGGGGRRRRRRGVITTT